MPPQAVDREEAGGFQVSRPGPCGGPCGAPSGQDLSSRLCFGKHQDPSADTPGQPTLITSSARTTWGAVGRRRDRPSSLQGCCPFSSRPATPCPSTAHPSTPPPRSAPGVRGHTGALAPSARLPAPRWRTKAALGTSASHTWSHLLPARRPQRPSGIRSPRKS